MESAKLVIEVQAGVVPGTPIPEYTQRWGWTSSDQEKLSAGNADARSKWLQIHGHASEYAASLRDPSRVNWVRVDWIWL